MTEPIYGLSKSSVDRIAEVNRIVLGRRPETGRRTRRVWNQGTGGGGDEIIAFQLTSADCDAMTATATVIAVPCSNGTGLEVGDSVDLVDFVGCFLTGNESLLNGVKGYASKMNSDPPDTPEESQVGCRWHIHSLCCPTESC